MSFYYFSFVQGLEKKVDDNLAVSGFMQPFTTFF